MFIVLTTNRTTHAPFWLRSTIWTSDVKRATRFPTEEAAHEAIARAMKFSGPRRFAKAFTTPVVGPV